MSDSGKKRRNGPPGGDGGPRKKKGHYLSSATGRSTADKAIPLGALGLLVTCESGREFKAFDEMIRLLEESFQRLGKDHVGRSAPSQQAAAAGGADTAPAADATGDAAGGEGTAAAAAAKPRSIADQLAAEVADLKKERVHRFRRHITDVRGTVFVEFPKADDCPSPESVAHEIACHVKETRSLPARHVLRLLPVTLTCFASKEELVKITADMVGRYFPTEGDTAASQPSTFSVEFEHRSSDKLKRADVIDIVAKAVPQPPYKVNLNTPDRTILVQLVRNAAAISVVPSFKQLAKYNLRRLTEEEEEQQQQQQQQKGAGQGTTEAAAAAGEPSADNTAAAAAAEEEEKAAEAAEAPAEAEAAVPAETKE